MKFIATFPRFLKKLVFTAILLIFLWEGHASKKTRNVPSPEIYIDRLGPDVPEAYVSNRSLIVSQKIKDSLFTSGLTGFTPILAVKNKIIKCDWKNLSELSCKLKLNT